MRVILLAVAVMSGLAAAQSRPLYPGKPLTDAELTGRSLRELTLMRNWVYAKRGNEFRRMWLRTFFTAQKWYTPNQKGFLAQDWRSIFDDEELNLDNANAERIATWESNLTVEQ